MKKFRYECDMDWKTFYLVSNRAYPSLTGRPEEEPILEHCPESGKATFTEKWWYSAEKVPCDTISSFKQLKEALEFKGSFMFGTEWDTYHLEVKAAPHYKKDIPPTPISKEDFFKYIEDNIPKIPWRKRFWRNLVWYTPNSFYDNQGFRWKVNGNGPSVHRISSNQLGNKVYHACWRMTSAIGKLLIPFGYNLGFALGWHEPTTQMTWYRPEGKTDHNRIWKIGRIGVYKVKFTPKV